MASISLLLSFILIALVAGYVANLIVGKGKGFETWELFVAGIVGAILLPVPTFQRRGDQVARRARTSRSSHRPGGQGPDRSRKAADAPATASQEPVGPTAEAAIDAAIDSLDSQYPPVSMAVAAPLAEPKQTRRARRSGRSRPDDLAAHAAAEDVWVREDLRRIGVVSLILLASLAVAWVVFVLLDVLNLY